MYMFFFRIFVIWGFCYSSENEFWEGFQRECDPFTNNQEADLSADSLSDHAASACLIIAEIMASLQRIKSAKGFGVGFSRYEELR